MLLQESKSLMKGFITLECSLFIAYSSLFFDVSFGRNLELYNDGQLKSTFFENVASISGTGSENLDAPSVSHPEVTRNGPQDATHGLQYNFPSVSSYSLPRSSQTNATSYTYIQGNSQLQSLSPFSSLMVKKFLISFVLLLS